MLIGLKEAEGQLLVDLHLCPVWNVMPSSAAVHTLSFWKHGWNQRMGLSLNMTSFVTLSPGIYAVALGSPEKFNLVLF